MIKQYLSLDRPLQQFAREVDYYYMNPKTLRWLCVVMGSQPATSDPYQHLPHTGTLLGVSVYCPDWIPEFEVVPIWNPPAPDRFWSIEASDEVWARPLGFGSMVNESRRVIYGVKVPKISDFLADLDFDFIAKRIPDSWREWRHCITRGLQ